MKKLTLILTALTACLASQAQVTSCASFLNPGPVGDVVVPFRYTDAGKATPLEWGLDLAWLSEDNLRTGILYAGKDMIDVVRLSFQPTASVDDSFTSDQKEALDSRVSAVKAWCKSGVGYYINDDNPSVDDSYNQYSLGTEGRARLWAQIIDKTADYYKQKGLTNLVTISPFNEPDYYTGQGFYGSELQDFTNICRLFKEDEAYAEKYADVRISGGNTLNTDQAYNWWNTAKEYLDEGNTHQLAGSFDNYVAFYQALTEAGHHATNDELHNVMECMVGAEYGMQTGIWWGTNENVRTQFMKATYHENPGQRLAYAEHRGNWTAASVYRQPDGQVQAFGGMSERQSYTTVYDFLSLDQTVWYDGQRGRAYAMYLPGGTGYQEGQSDAEVMVNVQAGTDVMPHIGQGTYKIMNVNSGKIMGFSQSPSKNDWTQVSQRNNGTYKYLQWNVTPLQSSGDFSYYTLEINTGNDMYLDILNWDYTTGASVGVYHSTSWGTNEQWYLEYAGNGAFYIRSRYSAKCLEVAGAQTLVGANIQMADFTGEANQQWRFLATGATPDLEAPAAPANLQTQLQGASVKLTWDAVADKDLMEYCVVRNGSLLARGITDTEFTDNEAEQDSTYSYYVFAVDKSYNRSEPSNEVTGNTILDEPCEVMHLSLSSNLWDSTDNGNHAAIYGDTIFTTNNEHNCLQLKGSDQYIQLPYTVASHDAITVACWLCPRGGDAWQRVFDFGNGTDQYMFLTTNCGSGVRFAIKDGGDEETVDAGTRLTTTRWYHIAVTLDGHEACIYINGELKGSNENISIKPSDLRPALNYIGRSQYASDPLLIALIHDFTVYNYALTAKEIAEITTGIDAPQAETEGIVNGQEYDLSGRRANGNERGIIIRDGKKVLR